MKYLERYKNYTKDFMLTDEDYDIIEQELLKKFKENNIEPDANALYFELQAIKKEPNNTYTIPIIRKLRKDKYRDVGITFNARHIAIKFFNNKYKDILDQYKKDKKQEFDIDNDKNGDLFLPFENELIKVPNKIGHNYIPLKILPLEDLQTKYSRHKRLKTFAQKGLKCVSCYRVGKYLIAAKDKSGQIHIDLYTKDFELMTVDHRKPKRLGGTYDIENLDPMCCFCNTKKGGDYDVNEKHKIDSDIYNQLKNIANNSDSFERFQINVTYYGYKKLIQVDVNLLINTEKISGREIKTYAPIIVGQDIRSNKFYIIDGHNRVKKAKKENVHYIDAYVTRGIISTKGGFSLEPETSIFVEQEKINLLDFYNKIKNEK
ncbi:HNH endonuclease [Candidatus Dojkabacteria bacterium]|jgi:hypothetical protein|nr:HNH endonuclease [Candidatus Dojkabacteria bacterium]